MPEFNRWYTYGTGHFKYILRLEHGQMYVDTEQLAVHLVSPSAIKFHLTEVTKQEGFHYI